MAQISNSYHMWKFQPFTNHLYKKPSKHEDKKAICQILHKNVMRRKKINDWNANTYMNLSLLDFEEIMQCKYYDSVYVRYYFLFSQLNNWNSTIYILLQSHRKLNTISLQENQEIYRCRFSRQWYLVYHTQS